MSYFLFNGANAPKPTPKARRTRRTLVEHPDFPNVRNVEEALVELGKRPWFFSFKKEGYTPKAYHQLLVAHGFEYRDHREITEHTVACTLNNLSTPKYGSRMEKLKYKWGRRGKDPVLQYAPTGKVADELNADDKFLVEVFRSLPNVSTFRLVSLWWQNRGL